MDSRILVLSPKGEKKIVKVVVTTRYMAFVGVPKDGRLSLAGEVAIVDVIESKGFEQVYVE